MSPRVIEYPPVAGEFETVRKLYKGRSIARFGDGEVKVMERHVYTRELEAGTETRARR